jgi:predicted ArsR family transcriptional regulator
VSALTHDGEFPVRSDDLLLSLLGRALDRLPTDEAEMMAEEVGAEYGRAMAAGLTGDALVVGQRSLRSAMQAVADALTAHGFAAHAEGRNNQLRIINEHCPFGEVATEHPVICAVDRGMVRGMLGELYDAGDDGVLGDVTTESSVARGDTYCSTAV